MSDMSTAEGPRNAKSRPQYEQRVVRAIRRIMRAVDIYSHRLALDSGITVPQTVLSLTRILEGRPMPLKAVARGVDLSASTTVGMVDRLEKEKGSGVTESVRAWTVGRSRSRPPQEGAIVAARFAVAVAGLDLAGALDALPEPGARPPSHLYLERIVELDGDRTGRCSTDLRYRVSLQADARLSR